MITPDLLRAATGCTAERAQQFAHPISEACALAEIIPPRRLAFFLANVAQESGALRWLEELWGPTEAQKTYEGRKGLGNAQPGDGYRYRGRGLLQTTGRSNYRELKAALLLAGYEDVPDFEAEPDRLAEPRWAAASAGHYWSSRGLNAYADAGDFAAVCKGINLGNPRSARTPNGMAERMQCLSRAQAALAALATTPPPAPIPAPAAPIPAAPAPAPTYRTPAGEASAPEQEQHMAPLLVGLAASLIDAFTPLAKEKLTKELGRHTDHPEVAEQVSAAIIETAKAATGKADPIDATSAAKADVDVVQKIEASALDELAKMGPVLDKLFAAEKALRQDYEASMDAAARRAATSTSPDQDEYLTKSIVRMVVGILIGGAVLTSLLAYLEVDVQVVLGALLALVGGVGGKFQTRFDNRYGSSAGSAAKDVVIQQMQQRGK